MGEGGCLLIGGGKFIYDAEWNSKEYGRVWKIEDKQFQEAAIKARKCRFNIIDELLSSRF